ncbi:hypothetical protein KEM55_000127 [Ascosphaera atra]|nr:hypothetical protein KEM55_000127 [Ascosphaera atra]
MSTNESPAQLAARLRREKREAKIKAGGASRLERITGLSGRPAASGAGGGIAGDEVTATPTSTPAVAGAPQLPTQTNEAKPQEPVQQQTQSQSQASQASTSPPSQTLPPQPSDPVPAQEEYLRALLRSQHGVAPPETANPDVFRPTESSDDPTMALLNTFLSGKTDVPGAGIPGLGSDSALGQIAGMFKNAKAQQGEAKPESPAEIKAKKIWKLVHLFFGVFVAGYFLWMIRSSVDIYSGARTSSADGFEDFEGPATVTGLPGSDLRLPPPAHAQNPFAIFLLGEVMLTALRAMTGSTGGLRPFESGTWLSLLRDVIRDGQIVVFVLGVSSLWWGKHVSGEEKGGHEATVLQ